MTTTYGDIAPAVAQYVFDKMSKHVYAPIINPIDIPCRYCKAEPGQNCTRWRKRNRRRGKYKAPRVPHGDRVYDARIADEMARALTRGEGV